MEKLHFSTNINAPREKVWDILWNNATYSQWTAPFGADGIAVSDWKEGSDIRFSDAAGKSGMLAKIAAKRPNEYMSFRHYGMFDNGVTDTDSPEVKKWAGAEENYTLNSVNGGTELLIDMDITEDHLEFFADAWPKALEKVKALSEQ